ncbi:MAG: phosphoenolpyruvate carboxykinase [Candidatus Binatia bacterium]
MQQVGRAISQHGLEHCGICNVDTAYWNLPTPALYEQAIRRREAAIAHLGSLVVRTGHHTGRAPQDRFIVREPSSEGRIWWGRVNQPFDAGHFDAMHRRLLAYLQGADVFVQDCYVGADPRYRHRVRIVTESAWHSLFTRNMFVRPDLGELTTIVPDFTILHAPHFHADPAADGTRSEAFVLLHFGRCLVLIGGTAYAGEIKKSVFTIMNYVLPQQGVLPMHCSANVGRAGDTAIFFGLSGTGKTTLSADPQRTLIGDDEHGWSDTGVFNFEGGCYAKVIRLSAENEPEIYETTRRFGTILENVAMDPLTRRLDLDDQSLTENTRAAYPISHIANASATGTGGHPRHIIMLTCDAFGVLPPISRLDPAQAMYHFLSGYTAKVAGTEQGVTEPEATFSACFGAPFMPLPPGAYATLLGEKITRHEARVWLVNTGWSGGPYGVGSRLKLAYTRAMLHAALEGKLDGVRYSRDTVFGVEVATECPGVPEDVLVPRKAWQDPKRYDSKARELAGRFRQNFTEFDKDVPAAVRNAAPADM